jgi:dTDP-glucose 4,6-dehydratase
MAVELGWQAQVTMEEGLARTVAWYRKHVSWWRQLKDEGFQAYYQRQYG